MRMRFLTRLQAAIVPCVIALATPAAAAPLVFSEALALPSAAAHFPDAAAQPVQLPDDWSQSRPRYDGSVWYRVAFDAPGAGPGTELLAAHVPRVCSELDVDLNGQRIHSDQASHEPIAGMCRAPRLIVFPAGLLKTQGNVLDLRVTGHALQRVAARERAAALSELKVGRVSELSDEHALRLFWNFTAVQIVGGTLLVLGGFVLLLFALHRRERRLLYFGALMAGWALLVARVGWPALALDSFGTEVLLCSMLPPIVACAVLFLLEQVGLRSRRVAAGLAAQCLLVPLSLLWAEPTRTFVGASIWYALLALELLAAMGVHLAAVRKRRRGDWRAMLAILVASAGVLLFEMAVQHQLVPMPPLPVLQFAAPLLFLGVGSRMAQVFARALQAAEASRSTLEVRVKEITADIERNFSQLSELRVEQVTEKERKRIAADLHDDLGAKLLTIVHTSESERISTLAREALEEMRLSVRGLTGKPVRLADALADWRAETVSRLGQANIEADWKGPAEEIEHLLPARAYVQTTRILREAVSNIIKHSGASHCKVRSSVGERDFGMLVQDNGKGIPMELDGKLDRGHGMSSMKHRAKQLQGQCLVESGPGYGTVIRLTLPL
jgi:signal transduction histidine kinase